MVTTFTAVADGSKNAGRIASITHSGLTDGNVAYAYTYDDHGRVASFTSPGGTRTYSYDTFDQVTGASGAAQTAEAFIYDTNGNRTNGSVVTGQYNRIVSDATYSYLYDKEGNRTRRTTISTGEYEAYAWDYRQRLVSITKYSSANVLQWTLSYEYDGLDRRTRRTVRNAAGTVTVQQRFLYDSNVIDRSFGEVVIVLDERLAGEPYQKVDHRYLNGPLIDQVFADETGGNGVLWYLSDTQNTVRDVAKYESTTAGTQATVRNHLEYNTFGIVTTADDPTTVTVNDGDRPGLEGTGNEFSPQRSYTGREPDTATGLIYYRARWYDPRIGRFISEDPIGFAAGDANLSRYVGNSTPNAVDPSGLDGEFSVHWHHLFPQKYAPDLAKLGVSTSFMDSAQNGWYLLAEDHRKVHSSVGTTDWNTDWEAWIKLQKGKKITEQELIEQIEFMKRKHGLVNMDGTPRMGKAVSDVDGIPYGEWSQGKKNVAKWRKENCGAGGWDAGPDEKQRVAQDARLRSAGKPRGTSPAPDFDEKRARQAANSAAAKLLADASDVAKKTGPFKRGLKRISKGVPILGTGIGIMGYGQTAKAEGYNSAAKEVGKDLLIDSNPITATADLTNGVMTGASEMITGDPAALAEGGGNFFYRLSELLFGGRTPEAGHGTRPGNALE